MTFDTMSSEYYNYSQTFSSRDLITIVLYLRRRKKYCKSIPAPVTEASDTLFNTMMVTRAM